MCSSFFFSVSAAPSKVQVTLGTGRPVMVAGILTVVPALQFSRSWALTSRVTLGSTGHKENTLLLLLVGDHVSGDESVFLTQDVLDQDICRLGRLRPPGCVDGVDPELALFAFLQVWDGYFSGGVELVCWVHPPPIRRALLVHFNDVTFDRAAAVSVRRTPAEGDAALGLVFDLRGSGRTGDI